MLAAGGAQPGVRRHPGSVGAACGPRRLGPGTWTTPSRARYTRV